MFAQEDDGGVAIPDGEWRGVITATSAAPGGASAEFHGEMTLTSNAGSLDGSYTLEGSGAISGPGGHGTADYQAAGVVGGSATAPVLQPTGGSIHMVLTVEGHTQELTIPLGPEEGTSPLALTYGTCGQVVGRYVVTAEGMSGEGAVVLTRIDDLPPGTEGDYLTLVTDLMVDIGTFRDAALAGTAVSFLDLQALLDRAQALDRTLRTNEDCGLTSDGGLAFLITSAIEDLVRFALDNPGALADSDLFALTNSAVQTGVTGPAAIGATADGLAAELAAAWDSRLDGYIIDGDRIGIDMVAAVADLLGDAELASAAEAAADALAP